MNIKKIIKRNMKLSRKGKFRFNGKEIDLRPLVDSSAEEATIVSSIDKIIPVVSDRKSSDGIIQQITSRYDNIDDILSNYRSMDSKQNATIVIMKPIDKIKEFMFDTKNIEGSLMRQSTLPMVLKKIMLKWKNTIYNFNNNSSNAAVMLLPDITVLLNRNGGFIKPVMVNVLYIGISDISKMVKDVDKPEEFTKASILSSLMDVIDASINLGITDIYFNPYLSKTFRKNSDIVSEGLVRIVTSKKVTDNFHFISFDFDDDEFAIEYADIKASYKSDGTTIEDYQEYLSHKNKDVDIEEVVEKITVDDDFEDEIEDIDDEDDEEVSTTDKEVEKRKVLNDIAEAAEDDAD